MNNMRDIGTAILVLRIAGVFAFGGSAIVAGCLYWRVRGLKNSAYFALTAAASVLGGSALFYLSQTTAVNRMAVAYANVGIAMAIAGWSLVGLFLLRQSGAHVVEEDDSEGTG